MYRRVIVVVTWGLLLVCGFYFWGSGGHPAFGLACAVLVLVLIACAVDRRFEDRALVGSAPEIGLGGLQYRAGEEAIEFRWSWEGPPRRLRVLRSATRWPQTADAAETPGGDAVCVYEGVGSNVRDTDVDSLTDYRYAFFTESSRGWEGPLVAWVTAADPGDRIEAMSALEMDPTYERDAASLGLYLDDQAWNTERPGWVDYEPGWLYFPTAGLGAIVANLFVLPFKMIAELVVSVVALAGSETARRYGGRSRRAPAPDRRVVWPRAGTRSAPAAADARPPRPTSVDSVEPVDAGPPDRAVDDWRAV